MIYKLIPQGLEFKYIYDSSVSPILISDYSYGGDGTVKIYLNSSPCD